MSHRSYAFALFLALLATPYALLPSSAHAQTFIGPSGAAGTGYGAIGINANKNLSIGTSTVWSDTKLLIASTSTTSGGYAIQIIQPNSTFSGSTGRVFGIRNDGRVVIGGGGQYYFPADPTSGLPYFLSVYGGGIYVDQDLYSQRSNFNQLTVTQSIGGTMNASNITPGVLNGATGGNFAVNGNLGVNYTSQVGLPQTLSVLGGGYFQSNVGIGTTAPAYKLDVNGIVNSTGIYVNGSPYIGSQWITTSTNIYFNTGNVGIGTSAPSQKLHIIGNVSFAGAGATSIYGDNGTQVLTFNPGYATQYVTANQGLFVAGVFNNTAMIVRSNNNNADLQQWQNAAGSSLSVLDKNGNIGIGTTAPAYKLDVQTGSGVAASFNGPVIVATPTANSHAATKSYVDSTVGGGAGSTVGYWAQSASGGNIFNTNSANVGIGTTAPGYPLVVSSSNASATIAAQSPDSAHWAQVVALNDLNSVLRSATFGYSGSTSGLAVNGGPSGEQGFQGTVGNYPFTFYTNNTARIVLANSGNVGINSTSPGFKLDVVGTGSFSQPVVVGTPTQASHATTKSYVDSAITGGSGSAVGYFTLTGSNVYPNSTAYNVGIGTTGPVAKLNVVGADALNTTQVLNMSGTSGVGMVVTDANRIGAGISLPLTKLHVSNGNLLVDSTNALVFGTNGIGYSAFQEIFGDSSQNDLTFRTYQDYKFETLTGDGTAGTNRLTIKQNGNVGVGSITPGYKLDVVGTGSFSQPVVVGTPTQSSHAATKSYVDSAVTGGSGSAVGYWTLSGSSVYPNSTSYNVGVGTTTPSAPLNVYSQVQNVTSGGTAIFQNNQNFGSGIQVKVNNSYSSYYGYDLINSSASSVFRVDNSGSVYAAGTVTAGGINVPTLSLNGNLDGYLLTVNNTNSFSQGISVSTTNSYSTKNALDITSSAGSILRVRNDGSIGVGTTTINSRLTIQGIDSTSGNSGLNVTNSAGTSELFVRNDGNVGIATTAPGYKLDVSGTAQFSQPVVVGTPTQASHATTKSYVDSAITGGSGSAVGYFTLTGSNVYPNSTAYNVGIGTTSPGSKLAVAGNISFPDTGGSGTYSVSRLGYNDILSLGLSRNVNLTPTANGLTINAYDQFSVHTSVPGGITNAIQIYQDAPNNNSQLTFALADGRIAFTPYISSGVTTRPSALFTLAESTQKGLVVKGAISQTGNLQEWQNSSGTALSVVDANGNAGIGSTAPVYKLDVAGTAQFSQPVIVGTPTQTNHAATKSYVDSAITTGVSGGVSGTAGYHAKFTGANTVGNSLIYDNGTNVGIATTTPGSLLAVNGTASLGSSGRGLTVDGSNIVNITGGNLSFADSGTFLNVHTNFTVRDLDNAAANLISVTPTTLTYGGSITLGSKFTVNSATAVGSVPNLQLRSTNAYGAGIGSIIHLGGKYDTNSSSDDFAVIQGIKDNSTAGDYGGALTLTTRPNGGASTERLRINQNGNVGINSTSPVYKLDVVGTGSFSQPVVVGTPTQASHATTKSYVDSAIQGGSGSAVGYFTLTGSNVYPNSTSYNVGIGTTSPATPLHVNSAAGLATVRLTSGGYTTGYDMLLDTGGTAYLFNRNNGALTFGTNNAEQMRITSAGNVGIGTTGPGAKLDVVGDEFISNKTAAPTNSISQPGTLQFSGYGWNTNTGSQPIGVQLVPVSFFGLGAGSNSPFGQTYPDLAFKFLNSDSGSYSEKMRITGGGNVGIGSAVPAYKLDVVGTGSFTQPVIVGTPTQNGHAATKNYVDSAITGGSGSAVGYWTLSGSNVYPNSTAYNVGIGTTSPGALLQVGQNAGYGTTTGLLVSNNLTGNQYDRAYQIAPRQTSAASGNSILMYILPTINGGVTQGTQYGIFLDGKQGAGAITSYAGLATNSLGATNNTHLLLGTGTIPSGNYGIYDSTGYQSYFAGNVGIGATSTDAQLSVYNGNVAIKTTTLSAGVSFGELQFGYRRTSDGAYAGVFPSRIKASAEGGNFYSGSNLTFWTDPGSDTSLGTTIAERMRIDKSGNVGINSTAPAYKLDVSGTGSFSQPVVVGTPTASNHATTKSYVDSAITGGSSGGNFATISVSGTSTLATGGGNVGIGTTNPVVALDVQGGGVINASSAYRIGNGTFANQAGGLLRVGDVGGNFSGGTGLYANGSEGMRILNGNVGIGTTAPDAPLTVNNGAILNSASGVNYYRNVATYAPGTSPTGTMKITLPKAIGSGSFLNITIRGFNYIANANYGEWQVKIAGYDYSTGWHAYGSEISGNPPFSSVRLADDGTKKVILLGTTATSWVTPAVSITDVMVSSSSLAGWGSGWGIGVISSETGIANILSPTPSRNGQLNFATVPSAVPIATDSSYNSFYQVSGSQYARLGVVDGGGGISTRYAYLQGGFTGSATYYGLSLNPLGGNVGIGSVTPGYLLDVAGSGSFSQPVVVGTPTQASHATTKSYVDSMFTGSGQWTTTSTSAYFSLAGNVGIGTSAPVAKLDVNGAVALNNNSLFMRAGTDNNWRIVFGSPINGDGQISLLTAGNTSNGGSGVAFGVNGGGTTMYVDTATTNVGVGTTAPAAKLELGLGNISVPNPNNTVGIQITGDAQGNAGYMGNRYVLNNSTSNYAGFVRAVRTGGTTFIGLEIGSETNSGIRFLTNGTGDAAEKVRIANTGNVGIGSTNPSYLLDVAGTAQFSQPVVVGTPTQSSHAATKNYVDSAITGGSSGGNFATLSSTGTSTFATASGRVGIGTTAPTSTLHLYSGQPVVTLEASSNGSPGIIWKNTAKSFNWNLNASGDFQMTDLTSGPTRMFIRANGQVGFGDYYGNSNYPQASVSTPGSLSVGYATGASFTAPANGATISGNVGIGTTAPGSNLAVLGANAAPGSSGSVGSILRLYNSTNAGIDFGAGDNGTNYYGWIQAHDITNNALNKPLALNQNGGNVGIGSASPQYLLDVAGTGSFTQPIVVGTPTQASHAATKNYVDSTLTTQLGSSTSTFQRNSTNVTLVNSGDSVGLGVVTPGAKLDVRGATQTGTSSLVAVVSIPDVVGNRGGFGILNASGGLLGGITAQNVAAGGANGSVGRLDHWIQATSSTQLGPVIATGGPGATYAYTGLGTTNPLYLLDVQGSANFTQPVSVGTPTQASHATTKSYVDSLISGGGGPWTLSGSYVYSTNSSNNVGIGSSTPGSKLVVVSPTGGQTAQFDGGGTSSSYIGFSSGGNFGYLGFGNAGNIFTSALTGSMALRATNALHLGAGGDQIIETLSAAGNVGIGSTNPQSKLDVTGAAAFSQPIAVGTPTNSNHATTKSYVDSAVSGGGGPWTLSGSNIYASNTGNNVGVGTTAANQKLDVQGWLRVQGNGSASRSDSGGIDFYNYYGSSLNTQAQIKGLRGVSDVKAGQLGFFTSAATTGTLSERMTIDETGNVGVGTSTPSQLFTVGNANQFTVNSTGVVNTNSQYNANGIQVLSGAGGNTALGSVNGTYINAANTNQIYVSNAITDFFGGVAIGSYGRAFNTITDGIIVSGNVGIASASPGYKLDVVGTGSFTQPVIVGTPTNTNHAATKSYVDSAVTGGAAGGNFATISVSGTSTLATTGGNVGIGTTNPLAKLEVSVPSGVPVIRLYGTTSGESGRLEFASNGSPPVWASYISNYLAAGGGVQDLRFYPGGNLGVTMTMGGNVGIGTTAPLGKLEVTLAIIGNTNETGAVSALRYGGNNGGSLTSRYYGLGVGAVGGAGQFHIISSHPSAAGTTIGTYDGTTFAPQLSITNASGNVGIGSLTPGYKLDVSGTGSFSQPIVVGTPTQASHAATKNYVDSVLTGGSSNPNFATISVSGTSTLATTGGNVGIGTTNPTANLMVAPSTGPATMQLTSSNSNAWANITRPNAADGAFQIQPSSGLSAATPQWNFGVQGALNGYFSIYTWPGSGGVTSRLVIDNNGNVGIGTTAPTHELSVQGTVSQNHAQLHVGNSGNNGGFSLLAYNGTDSEMTMGAEYVGGAYIARGTQASAIWDYQSQLQFYHKGGLTAGSSIAWGSPSMALDVNGNLGIGSATPAYKLDVAGTAQFSQPVIVGTPTQGTHAATKSYVDSMFTGSGQWTTSGSSAYFSLAGNVGIGSSAPGEKLDIGGDYRSTNEWKHSVVRTMPTVVNNEVDIGSFTFSNGGGSLWVSVTVPSGGYSVAKQYLIPVQYSQPPNNTWVKVLPLSSTGPYSGNDFDLDINVNNNVASLRIRDTLGTLGGTAYVVLRHEGVSTDTFVASSATSAVSAPTAFFTSTALTQTGGNLGIGTTGPAALVNIVGSAATNNSASTYGLVIDQGTGRIAMGSDNTYGYIQTFGGKVLSINPAGNNVIFNGTGNVGIASTAPAYKLDVVGTAQFSQPVIVGTPTAANHATTKSYVDSILTAGTATSSFSTLSVGTTTVPTGGVATFNGNVGIGTTTPSQLLAVGNNQFTVTSGGIFNAQSGSNVNGTFYVTAGEIVTSPGTAKPVMSLNGFNYYGLIQNVAQDVWGLGYNTVVSSNGTTTIAWAGNGNVGLGGAITNSSMAGSSMAIISGNVGIGSTAPAYKLDVVGTAQFSQPVIVGTPTNSNHAATKSYVDSMFTGSGQWTTSGTNAYYSLAGNVGIGSATPGSKLDVAGTVKLTSAGGDLQVDGSGNTIIEL